MASYKFALGKSLLELADQQRTFIKLEDLAEPFSRYICEHLGLNDKQGVSSSSKFLNACRGYNSGEISRDELLSRTVSLGFNNVIDAFHIVNGNEIPTRFYIDERKERNGITVTDELLALKDKLQFLNLPFEVEARWRLVETAWSLGLTSALLEIKVDQKNNLLFAENHLNRRINITSCRDSLNGYQKGKCFYCFREIVIDSSDPDRMADVDHFFPYIMASHLPHVNINGVWNLVLACMECNRGEAGKSARIPALHLLERLYERNEYLIDSHHPLRETLMRQTGSTLKARTQTLQNIDRMAINKLIHRWQPSFEHDFRF